MFLRNNSSYFSTQLLLIDLYNGGVCLQGGTNLIFVYNLC